MDRELVVRAQQGDRDAFTSIATSSYARLHRIAQNILSDRHLAEDATQHALIEMWRNMPQLRDPERLEAAIETVLSDSTLREGLGAAARRRVEARYTVAAMTDGYEALYVKAVA